MKLQIIKNIIIIFFIGATITCYAQTTTTKGEKVGETIDLKDKNIDWEKFDTTSTFSKQKIKTENLQGLWKAYKGVYRFGEHVNAMELTTPYIIEIRNDTYRRKENGEFKKYKIQENLIIKEENGKVSRGIINKITETQLTISWKDGSNYTRYYYEK
ncbi:MAG: hypothetical protein IIA88_06030 [Bacteroidetes bacterium]|nr:hypothetical protein [Bacteroidota bacterium]